ncbi:hypothetical protein FMUAM8_09160 [Nocardia cyriacigeorgica]|nr:hypothetical protein FMUAM8_09160 [Nocardia cyriacigeorgica]
MLLGAWCWAGASGVFGAAERVSGAWKRGSADLFDWGVAGSAISPVRKLCGVGVDAEGARVA